MEKRSEENFQLALRFVKGRNQNNKLNSKSVLPRTQQLMHYLKQRQYRLYRL